MRCLEDRKDEDGMYSGDEHAEHPITRTDYCIESSSLKSLIFFVKTSY